MNKRQILNDTAALLSQPHRWGQGAYSATTDHGACFCIFGALANVAEMSGDINMVEEMFAEPLAQALGIQADSHEEASEKIIEWHDAETRKASEVVAVLRQAARDLA